MAIEEADEAPRRIPHEKNMLGAQSHDKDLSTYVLTTTKLSAPKAKGIG